MENERGFKQDIVRATQKPIIKKKIKKIDVAVQSEAEMENKSTAEKVMQDFLAEWSVMQKPKTVCVENATNTEEETVQIGKTADLLDTLQEALVIKPVSASFKAHVIVENALHLPVRKKCKSRKSKNKVLKKQEDCLPSTFVTFETGVGADLKISPVVHKTTNPRWDFRCDVTLPRELLTNVSIF